MTIIPYTYLNACDTIIPPVILPFIPRQVQLYCCYSHASLQFIKMFISIQKPSHFSLCLKHNRYTIVSKLDRDLKSNILRFSWLNSFSIFRASVVNVKAKLKCVKFVVIEDYSHNVEFYSQIIQLFYYFCSFLFTRMTSLKPFTWRYFFLWPDL